MKKAIYIVQLLFFASACTAQNQDLFRALDNYLSDHEAKGFNGMVWAEIKGEVILNKAYGYANRRKDQPMTLEHGFSMGSIQKWFTRLSIELLEKQGKLSTRDRLTKYFNEVPADKREITLEQVIQHKSGLVNYLGDDYEVINKQTAVERALNAALVSEPGKSFNYSNGGYSLLAIIIEEVSGLTYEDFVYVNFLKPAGMKKTGYLKGGWTADQLAMGYHADGREWGTSLSHPWAEDGPSWTLRGNGGMLTTIEDLRKMIGMLSQRPDAPKTIGTAGGNGIFNVDIEWDLRKNNGIIIMSSDERFLGEDLILQNPEGKKLLNKILKQ